MHLEEGSFHPPHHLKKKLTFAERKFKAVTEATSDLIIITDNQSRIIFSNSKSYKFAEYDPEELLSKNISTLIHIHDDLSQGQRFETFIFKKTGLKISVECSVSYWEADNEVFGTWIIRDISHQIKDAQLLKDSESKFCLIANNSSDVISIHHLDGKILYVSPSSSLVFGYTPEEMVGKNMKEFGHPEDVYRAEKILSDIIHSQDIHTLSFRFRKKDGQYIWVESTTRIIRDDKGTPLEIHASARDISIRKSTEEQLKDSRYFIQKIMEASPSMIFVSDIINNTIVYANKKISDLGYNTEELKTMQQSLFKLIVHPDDMPKMVLLNARVRNLQEGEMVESEIRIKHAIYDAYRWVQMTSTVFKKNEEGKVWLILNNSQDITDKKQAENDLKKAQQELVALNRQLEEKIEERTNELHIAYKNLQQSEDLLKIATNIIPVFISYVNRDKIFKYTNDFYSNLYFVKGSPMGKHMIHVLGEEAYHSNEKYIEKALQGEPSVFTTRIKFKDGSVREIETRYIPDKDKQGEVRGFVVMGMDLTERNNYEKRLTWKKEELRKTNNDLENFIYTASHDLKAPIANIEGLVHAIRTSDTYMETPAEIKELFNLIEASVERFKHTIIDLTEINKAQKSFEDKVENIEIADVIDEMKFMIKDLIQSSHAKIKVDLSVHSIMFSKRNFRSIVYNLLSNAIKYQSPNRPPSIEIATKEVGEYMLLSIKDNGLGIEPDKQDKIFSMFKRMHDHVEGTGVGLYIVKRIVDNAGGKIEVESHPDQGAIFRIYLRKSK